MCTERPAMRTSRAKLISDYSLEITSGDIGALATAEQLIPAETKIAISALSNESIDARLEAAAAVKRLKCRPVPHISARGIANSAVLETFLLRLATEVGVQQVLVIGGDVAEPRGPYYDALAVIQTGLLEKYGIRTVSIGGYPEGHNLIDHKQLWQSLKDKIAELRARGHNCEIVTQFGFNAEAILTWLERLRDSGINEPVRIGLAGPASAKSLLRFAARCGVAASRSALRKYGVSLTKLLSVAGPDRLFNTLEGELDPAVHGEVRAHFYPFGGLSTAASWAAERSSL